jgi:serine/threonine protein kinase
MAPGTKVGEYEIVEPIGKGGMGEVYRARDPKLDGRRYQSLVHEMAFRSEPLRHSNKKPAQPLR